MIRADSFSMPLMTLSYSLAANATRMALSLSITCALMASGLLGSRATCALARSASALSPAALSPLSALRSTTSLRSSRLVSSFLLRLIALLRSLIASLIYAEPALGMLSWIGLAESGAFSARAIYALTAASNRPALLADSSNRTEHQSLSQALLVVRTVFS